MLKSAGNRDRNRLLDALINRNKNKFFIVFDQLKKKYSEKDFKTLLNEPAKDGVQIIIFASSTAYSYTTTDKSDFLRLLLENGTNINAQDKNGVTALMHLCNSLKLNEIELLLDDSNINCDIVDNDGNNALFWLFSGIVTNNLFFRENKQRVIRILEKIKKKTKQYGKLIENIEKMYGMFEEKKYIGDVKMLLGSKAKRTIKHKSKNAKTIKNRR